MVLPDWMIEKLAEQGYIEPYTPENLQPSSYDVLLGNTFRVFKNPNYVFSPLQEPEDRIVNVYDQASLDKMTTKMEREDGQVVLLDPLEFILGVTKERVRVPPDLVCRLEGKSSLGRVGLAVHITAGYIDPGFEGNITLEMVNFGPRPIALLPGMPIGQIGFIKMLGGGARTPYQGRYQGDNEATPSRYGKGRDR